MIPLLQAKTLALAATRVGPMERAGLLEAQGRFLADGVLARRPSPPLDLSAMDGYAVVAADTAGAKPDAPRSLRLVGELFAGAAVPQRDLAPGEAMRIFTGAGIPFGADAVVRQESATDDGHRVAVLATVRAGENIRRRGEDWREGQLLLEAGRRLDAGALAVLASLGLLTVPTRPWPRLAILTLGDELVEPGEKAEAHQTYDSNRTLLAARAVDAGAEVVALERCRDEDRALEETLRRLVHDAELIVTCGGASVGKRDRVKTVLSGLGASEGFDGVAIRPGKPVGLWRFSGVPVVALPGNPLAAAVTFDQLVRPMILKRLGVAEQRAREPVALPFAVKKPANLLQLVPARLERRETATVRAARGSPAQVLPLAGATGWLLLPEGAAELAEGTKVEFEHFEGATFRLLPAAGQEDTR